MVILGIESSCDETSIALVKANPLAEKSTTNKITPMPKSLSTNNNQTQSLINIPSILALTTWSQYENHAQFGGVVPEIAARAHHEKITELTEKTLTEAKINLADITGIAATAGPGLIGGLLVGSSFAKTLAYVWQKPFIAVNHLAAHALSVRLANPTLPFPYLLLLVSGGHCQLLAVMDVMNYQIYGESLDDSAGETFDKLARLMQLPEANGKSIEQLAKTGNAKNFPLPIPLQHKQQQKNNCDFSFSGLKTAFATKWIEKTKKPLSPSTYQQYRHDAAASLQATIADFLVNRSQNAMRLFQQLNPKLHHYHFCLAGGVGANQVIRGQLATAAKTLGFDFHVPPIALCTDNAAMVAWAGAEMFQHGIQHDLSFKARPKWPLAELAP